MVVTVPKPTEDRYVAFSMSMLRNGSSKHQITLVSAELIDAEGLELMDTFTVEPERQIAVGQGIPPQLGDTDEEQVDREQIANWAARTPLTESVMEPEDFAQLVLVIRVTTPDPCNGAKGFKLKYLENGRSHAVVSNLAMVVYSDLSTDQCEDLSDYYLANPL